MMTRRTPVHAIAFALSTTLVLGAAIAPPTPEQFAGHRIGSDNTLVRWDKIVEYLKLLAARSDRVRFRELGKTSNGNPFIALETSSPETLNNLDRYKQLERKLYFQGGAPSDGERDEIFRQGRSSSSSHAASMRPRSAHPRWRSNWFIGLRPKTHRT
jgi:hypothetical protein